MKANIKDNHPGIYCIENLINGKKYIGKAKNIHKRIKDHVTLLNTKSKDENPHLINSWHFYKRQNFSYFVVEKLELNPILIAERELYWQDFYNCHDSNFGYNLRKDSSTGMICSEETRLKLSIAGKERKEKFPELLKKVGKMTSEFWKNNTDVKKQMSKKVSDIKTKYLILKLDYDMNILQTWNTQKELKEKNPELYLPAILQVCNGGKNSYLGFLWRYFDISKNEIIFQLHPKKRAEIARINKSTNGKVIMKSIKDNSIIKIFESLTLACEEMNFSYTKEYQRLTSKTINNKKYWKDKSDYFFEYLPNNYDIV